MSWGDQRNLGGAGGPVAWSPNAYYKVGDLSISLVDFQPYCRKTAGSSSTDPNSDAVNWQPYGCRAVKSIQRGACTIAAGTGVSTITAVNMAKTELRFLGGYSVDGGGTTRDAPRIILTNSTTINAYGQYNGVAYWELTEYY